MYFYVELIFFKFDQICLRCTIAIFITCEIYKTEDGANGAGFDNRGKGFFIVNAVLLRKTATNPASFIARKSAVS